ncbi:MAG: FMN-binding protein, partial [Planctomycetia bacterium]
MIRLTALRLFRLLVIFFAGWLLMMAVRHSPTTTEISLDAILSFFPDARHLVANKDKLRSFRVIGKDGATLGNVLTTSPEMDGLVGYAGPSNLLLALDLQGKLLGVQLLSSADTISHVDAVRASNSFWKSFAGWQPNSETFPKIEAVGGSTLTSLAMTEAVERRLTEKT